MRRKLLLNLGSALALLAALAAGLWGFVTFDPHPSLRLRDGSSISLQAVWMDRPPEVVMGPRWMQLLYGAFPPSVRDQLGWEPSYSTRWLGTGVGVSLMHRSSRPEAVQAVLEDSHGCRFFPTESLGQRFGVDHELSTLRFSSAPRHDRLLVRIESNSFPGGLSREALVTPMPMRGRVRVWQADSLPTTRRNGGLSATLRSAGADFGSPTSPAAALGYSSLKLELDCSGEWRPFAVLISDDTGTSIHVPCSFQGRGAQANGRYQVSAHISVCRARTYKLRVEFSRVRTRRAHPDSALRAKFVSVSPGRMTPLPGDPGVRVLGTGVSAVGAIGVHGQLRTPRENWQYRAYSRNPPVGFVVAYPQPYAGNPLEFQLVLPAGTPTADLVVEGFRSRFLEWTVKPVWPAD